jgi:5'(3')-deoxyribonucleotidase
MRSFQFEAEGRSSTPIVYVDMDGVLADFFGEIAREHDVEYWREIHRKDLGIDQIAQEPGFFKMLPVLPNAGKLIKGVTQLASKYSILSSPLLSNVEESSKEKMQWLQRHLKNHQPQAVIFDHEKYKYAQQPDETPNILIDDWDTNIRLWEANGGIGILYKPENCKEALHKLSLALRGKIKAHPCEMAVFEDDVLDVERPEGKLYTSRQVLQYVQGIHHEYHMPKPIMAHTTWVLRNVPVSNLKTPEFVHQDDPYRRVIDINWDHVEDISMYDIKNRPIVVDSDGWVLDGNHRATAARARGLETVPAIVPYDK